MKTLFMPTLRWLLALLLITLAGPAMAATYTFPGALPPGCSGSNGSYTCSALALGWNESIAIAAPTPATITVNGDFTTATNAINSGGSASQLNLVVTGTLTLSYQTVIVANITAGAVSDSTGYATITGAISTGSGALSLGYGTTVSGALGSDSGAITVGQSGTVGGDISSNSGAIVIGYGARVGGAVATSGAITLQQNARVTGAVSGTVNAVNIGYGALVGGALSTSSGSITLAQNAQAQACVKSTASATITLGYQSQAARVCCGATCSTACVVNNSAEDMPERCPVSAAPTLAAGTRYSFESYDTPGSYIRHYNYDGWISPVSASSDALTKADATFIARAGLAKASCWSFESVNFPGRYLRHQNFVLRMQPYSSTALYLADATFCLRQGLADASAVSFEAYNYAGYYLQHDAVSGTLTTMRLATVDGSASVNGRATFVPRSGWSGFVDHYELRVPSSSLACTPTTVTVQACADASSPCGSGATNLAGQTATLSASAGSLGATALSFDANGQATTTLSYPAAADGASVNLSLSNESVAATAARQCCPDGANCSAANSCASSFHTAGFIFSAAAGGAATTLPTQTAGSSSANYILRAVRSNTSTQACQAALTGANTVNWGYQCNNPGTCASDHLLSITGSAGATPVAGNANGSSANSTAVAMNFDANGNAPFSFNHADVGQLTLLASKPAGGSLLTPLSGSSNAFVVKPAGFVLSGIRCSSYAAGSCATAAIASPGNNPGASSASGTAFMPAGQPFSVTVTAVNAAGAATPSYGREATPEGVQLSAVLLQPAGGHAPALGNASVFGAFSGGSATGTTFAWNEVGIISLTPSVADGDYLGAGPVTGSVSGAVGRFIPAGFALSAGSVSHRSAMSCASPSAFTYLGENFQLSFALTAQGAGGATLQNYTGAFAKLDPSVASQWNLAGVASGTSFTTTNGRLSLGTATGSWVNGQASAITLTASAQRAATPDGPFAASFGIAPSDSDGVGMASYDINVAGSGNDHANVAGVALRFGRLRLANAIGDQTRPLGLPLTAQYWNGSLGAFDTNTLDSCTTVPASAVSFGKLRGTLVKTDLGLTTTSVGLSSGVGVLRLKAPTGGRRGTADLALSLGSTVADASCLQTWAPDTPATTSLGMAYLRGAWCASTYTKDPSARASFGLYRGADSMVYMRENY